MRQRQPDRADLLPARRDAVDDAPRDDEMAARVVVAEREAEPVIVPARRNAPPTAARRAGNRERRTAARRSRADGIITCLFYGRDSSTGSAALALALGAPGLFLVAFLDSSFLSLPGDHRPPARRRW